MPKWHFLTITVYEKYPKITDIFLLNSVGIVTSRDEFVISTDREKLEQKIRMFCDEELSDENIRQIFKLRDKSNWKLQDKRAKIRDEKGHVYINADQYFEGVTKEIWEYQIGGYQVCQKWLKDRKDRTLSLDEIKHYSKIVTALQKTMEIQKLIDDIYPEVEKDIIEF